MTTDLATRDPREDAAVTEPADIGIDPETIENPDVRAVIRELQSLANDELIAAAKAARAKQAAAAWNARVAGLSTRVIGEYLGVSHVQVLRLCKEHESAGDGVFRAPKPPQPGVNVIVPSRDVTR